HALGEAFLTHPTLASLHADPRWPALAGRLSTLLSQVRTHSPELTPYAAGAADRVRLAQWNIEHGNQFDAIERALMTHPDLAAADIVTLNEVDLGMARSGNRDVAGELAA